jgi:hypothetical protein
VGYQSGLRAGNNSDYNTLIGYQSGYGITTGSSNIIIGTATSSTGVNNLTTGSQNILIGNNISLPSATANGQLNIGNIIFGTNITGTGSTLSSGNVGIGTSSPNSKLTISGSGAPTGGLYDPAWGVPTNALETHYVSLSGLSGGNYINNYANQYLKTDVDTTNSNEAIWGSQSSLNINAMDSGNASAIASGGNYLSYLAPVSAPSLSVYGIDAGANNYSAGHIIGFVDGLNGIARNGALGATTTAAYGASGAIINFSNYTGITTAEALNGAYTAAAQALSSPTPTAPIFLSAPTTAPSPIPTASMSAVRPLVRRPITPTASTQPILPPTTTSAAMWASAPPRRGRSSRCKRPTTARHQSSSSVLPRPRVFL